MPSDEKRISRLIHMVHYDSFVGGGEVMLAEEVKLMRYQLPQATMIQVTLIQPGSDDAE